MTLLEVANKFPPCVCRMLARKKNGHAPLSVREIAQKSGISKSIVATLSMKDSWEGVAIEDVVQFSLACGVDLMRPAETMKYIRRSKRVHLENADPSQKKFFLRLFSARS